MKVFALIFCIILGVIGCNTKTEYELLLDKEMSSGKRFDSLFFSIRLRQSKQQFFEVLRNLNKKGILYEGVIDGQQAAKYRFETMTHPAEMNFYPKFYKDQLCDMQATFHYEAWAPWNKELDSEHLQEDVIDLLEKWYGKGFIKITSRKERWPAFVKINGNRRISVFRSDDRMVRVFFTDLLIEKELKAGLNN